MESSSYRGGGRGPLGQGAPPLGGALGGPLCWGPSVLDGGEVPGVLEACREGRGLPSLLRLTLLQLQRALTQNAALADGLREAASGGEATISLLSRHKVRLEEAAERNAAATHKALKMLTAQLQAAQSAAEEARGRWEAKVEGLKGRLEEEKAKAALQQSVRGRGHRGSNGLHAVTHLLL